MHRLIIDFEQNSVTRLGSYDSIINDKKIKQNTCLRVAMSKNP